MQPIVLCGLGRVGGRVLEFLQKAGLPVVVVDSDCSPHDARLGGATLVTGDCRQRDVLARAGVADARAVLILTSDDLVNISTALTARSLAPGVRIVLRMFNDRLIPQLGKAVQNVYALSTSILTAPLFALTALTGQALGAFRLDEGPDGRRQVAQVTITHGSTLAGRTVAEIAAARAAVVVAHLPVRGPGRYVGDVEDSAAVAPGDRLVLCGRPRDLAPLLAQGSAEDLPGVRWAGFVRRHLRALGRTLSEVDMAVKICTGVLFGVIALSTLILHISWRRADPEQRPEAADALFRTISLLATGADMRAADYEYTPGLKVFVSALRIIGAALTAAFTAIVTNYLLRARLGGALEVRRIPDGGHVIVCGLGNVGYRVVEELLGMGERVVAVELSRDNRFLATARRQGVPVIVGDATVREVLRQAHAPTARAVIAASSNDMVNLEVALLARDLNAQQRIVLRLSDPQLADLLREAANVRLALSVPALAAPAFVAALFGDRVLGVCLVEGRMLAVVNLQFSEPEPLSAAVARFGLVPLAVTTAEGKTTAPSSDTALQPGDHLVAFVALAGMERLLRRDISPSA